MKDLKSSVAKVLAFVFLFTAACGNLSAVAFAGPLPITMSVLGSVPSQVYFGSVMKWKDTYLSLADFEWNSASSTGSVLFAAKNSSLREWDSVYYSGAPGQIAFSDEYVAVVSGDSLIFSSNARDWQQSFLPSAYALIANLYCINSKFIVTAYNNDASKYVCLETADFLEYFEISLPQLTYTEIDARYIQCHDGKLYYIYYEDPLGTSTLSNAKIISSTSLPGAWSEVGSFVRVTGNDYRLHELRWNKDGTPQVYGCYDTAAATPLNSNIKSSNWTDWTNSTPDGTLYPQTSNPYLASDNIESAPKHPVNETVTIRIGNQASFEPYIYWGASLIHPRSATPSPTPPPNTFRAVKYVPYSDFVDSEEVPDGVTRTYSIYTNNFALPDGLFLVPGTGEISGVPLESTSGPRSFSVKIEYEATSDSSLYVVENCNISVGDNLDMAVLLESDPSYEFVTPAATETLPQLAGTIRSIQDHLLVSIGRYPEFDSLYIDGHLQDPASDYTAYEGSTKIVVKAQTIEKYGEGTHTIAAKFLSTDSSTGTSTLKRAALNYHLDLSSPTTSYSPSYTSGSFSAGASLAPLSRTLKASVANKTATAILTARLLKEASVEGDPITVTSPLGDFVVDPVAVKDIGFSTDVVASYTVESLASGSVDISASLSRFGKEIKDFGKGIITISIPYSLPNGVNWTQVAPYHKSSENLVLAMGGYNVETKKVDLHLRHLSDYAVRVSDKKYTGRGGWYDESLDWAVQRGLLDKYIVNGEISAAQEVSREDFIVTLLKSLGIQPLNSYTINQFSDVGGESANYIRTARQLGIISGVGNNLFAPNSVAKRGEQFQIVYNLIQANLTSFSIQNTGKRISDFRDAASVPQWLNPALTELLRFGIVQGDGMNLNVGDNFSIGQISVVLKKMASPKAAA